MVKSYQLLESGTGFEDGINFYGHFSEHAVNDGLQALSTVLPPNCGCYCLRVEVEGDLGVFKPFGKAHPPTGSCTPTPPERVPLQALVDNVWDWPLFRLAHGEADERLLSQIGPQEAKEFLSRMKWTVQIRLQDGSRFVGYFKIVGFDAPPDPRLLQIAFYHTKFHVLSTISNSILRSATLSDVFHHHLETTLHALLATSSEQQALHHVGDMLTSHLGVGWHRCATYFPTATDCLQCVWAQGGDGRDHWCSVQEGLSHSTSAEELIAKARSNSQPSDDVYRIAAAGAYPVTVSNISDCANRGILATVWRLNGGVERLPPENRELDFPEIGSSQGWTQSRCIAALFDETDPWVHSVRRSHPGAPIFVARSQRYWALPWRSGGGNLLGIVVLDMAYWGGRLPPHIVVPKLVLAAKVLDVFAPKIQHFRQLSPMQAS